MKKFFITVFALTFFTPLYALKTVSVRTAKGVVQAEASTVLVQFKSTVAKTDALAVIAKYGVVYNELSDGWYSVTLKSALSVQDALSAFAAETAVQAAQPNHIYKTQRFPNDPLAKTQYSLSSMDAPAAWEYETGASNPPIITIIDTGVDNTHPEVNGRILSSSSRFNPITGVRSDEPQSTDCDGHGTHVAGIATASSDNGIGIAGVAWDADILSLRIFDSSDNCYNTSDAAIAAAINYAANIANSSGRRMVINMSLGGEDPCASVITSAVNNALASNVVIVAAAGNYSNPVGHPIMCPANLPGVLAVGAITDKNSIAYFSARGSQMFITAPGYNVLSLAPGGGYVTMSGTSMASPHVAGAAGLLLSALPSATTSQISQILSASADDMGPSGFDETYGYGKLNLFKALRLAKNDTLSDYRGIGKAIAFPNPFRPNRDSQLSFSVPSGMDSNGLEIKIFTSEGEPVKTISGLTWDGRNESGQQTASGTYVFFMKSESGSTKGRFAIIR